MAAGDASIPTQRSVLLGDHAGINRVVGINESGHLFSPVPNTGQLIQDETLNDQDKLQTVPAGKVWRVLWIHVHYIATATAGSRIIQYAQQPSGLSIDLRATCPVALTAAFINDITFISGAGHDVALQSETQIIAMPQPWIASAGTTLRVLEEAGVDAADDMDVSWAFQEYDEET